MDSQLRWLERTPDKREVDGSIPFEPTKLSIIYYRKYFQHIEKYIDKYEKYLGKTSILINSMKTIEPKLF